MTGLVICSCAPVPCSAPDAQAWAESKTAAGGRIGTHQMSCGTRALHQTSNLKALKFGTPTNTKWIENKKESKKARKKERRPSQERKEGRRKDRRKGRKERQGRKERRRTRAAAKYPNLAPPLWQTCAIPPASAPPQRYLYPIRPAACLVTMQCARNRKHRRIPARSPSSPR